MKITNFVITVGFVITFLSLAILQDNIQELELNNQETVTVYTQKDIYFLQGRTVLSESGKVVLCKSRQAALDTLEQWSVDDANNITEELGLFEYYVNIDLSGYDIFDERGRFIGKMPYGQCNMLDSIFIADNE